MSTARAYTLNPESARQTNASNYIDSTGKYIGQFSRAEAVISRQGTEGIEFTFQSNEGQTADFLTLWTYNANGDALYGLKVLNAIMTCLKVREITPQQGQVTRHDGRKEQSTVFPGLMNKPIGVLLQREAYIKQNGDEGYKFNIFAPFEAATELTASEILDGVTQPEKLGNMVANLKDRPMQERRDTPPQQRNSYADATNGGMADLDSDIPF